MAIQARSKRQKKLTSSAISYPCAWAQLVEISFSGPGIKFQNSVFQRQRHVNDVSFAPPLHRQSAPAENFEHSLILREHISLEPGHALLACDPGEASENEPSYAATAVMLFGNEGEFCPVNVVRWIFGAVTTTPDQLLSPSVGVVTTSATTRLKSTSVICSSSSSARFFL